MVKANRFAGFGTGNPALYGYILDPVHYGDLETLSNGYLTVTNPSGEFTHLANVGKSGSGAYYWEVTINSTGTNMNLGIANLSANRLRTLGQFDSNGWGWAILGGASQKVHGGTFAGYGATYAHNDVVGFVLDLGAGTLTGYLNGASQGVMYSGLTGTLFPAASEYSGNPCQYTFNFGDQIFSIGTIPAGAVAYNQP